MHYTYHPVADLFPLLGGDEYRALVNDILANGQLEPIWTLNGQILDGRNRYRACCELDIEPATREYTGDTDMASLVRFVLSLNLHRRHLTSSQLGTIGVAVEELLAADAKERQRAAGEQRAIAPRNDDGTFTQLPQIFAEAGDDASLPFDADAERRERESRELAAKAVGTNRQYISNAKKLKRDAPDLYEQVAAGTLTMPKAMQELKKRQRHETIQQVEQANTELPKERRKYRVIYADPPWQYGNTMPDYFDEQAHHYPLMSFAEIAAMPIRELAMDDAVLFLWVTSPILYDVKPIIDAWGFTYKAAFVWDKQKHNMGHYNSVRHELLLICVRGSCQPDTPQLFDSVQSIERGRHSEKPEQFRTIIDTIYPHGPRIELFARVTANGWDNYGNQVSRQPEPAVD